MQTCSQKFKNPFGNESSKLKSKDKFELRLGGGGGGWGWVGGTQFRDALCWPTLICAIFDQSKGYEVGWILWSICS